MKIKVNKMGGNPMDSAAQDAAERVKRALGSSGDVGTPMSLDAYLEAEGEESSMPQPLDFIDEPSNEEIADDDYAGPFTDLGEDNSEILSVIQDYEAVKIGEVLDKYYENRQSIDYTISQIKAIKNKTKNLVRSI